MLPQHTNVIVQQPLVSSSVVWPAVLILNKVFDSNITLLASFVNAVDNSSSYRPTELSFFKIFLSILLWLSNNTQCSILQAEMAVMIR